MKTYQFDANDLRLIWRALDFFRSWNTKDKEIQMYCDLLINRIKERMEDENLSNK